MFDETIRALRQRDGTTGISAPIPYDEERYFDRECPGAGAAGKDRARQGQIYGRPTTANPLLPSRGLVVESELAQ